MAQRELCDHLQSEHKDHAMADDSSGAACAAALAAFQINSVREDARALGFVGDPNGKEQRVRRGL